MMHRRPRAGMSVVAGFSLLLGLSGTTAAQKDTMTTRASGTFEVKMNPQAADDYADGKLLGRMSMDKTFGGDLDGTSKGQMLTALTSIKDSAGYVAIEKVTGTLKGLKGTFVLQHSGIMTRGVQNLTLTVVPDSGTDQLAGLAGKMAIKIEGGKHFYEFDYTIAKTP